MAYKIISSPLTENDIDNAVKWYVDIDTKIAKQFLAELKAVKKYISEYPETIQVRYKNIRVAYLKKFPFGVHYKFENKIITIVAVFNTSVDPKNWEKR